MKTWWDFVPALVLVFLLPFVAGALPTVEFRGHFLGGGVVRETAINHVAQWLPVQSGQEYVAAFSTATVAHEYVLYLPVALNIATLFIVFFYGFLSIYIGTSNWIDRQMYQSQRKASKGA